MHVLYAEDDNTLRDDFAEVLRCFFPDLLVAKDGVEAKKLYDMYIVTGKQIGRAHV